MTLAPRSSCNKLNHGFLDKLDDKLSTEARLPVLVRKSLHITRRQHLNFFSNPLERPNLPTHLRCQALHRSSYAVLNAVSNLAIANLHGLFCLSTGLNSRRLLHDELTRPGGRSRNLVLDKTLCSTADVEDPFPWGKGAMRLHYRGGKGYCR